MRDASISGQRRARLGGVVAAAVAAAALAAASGCSPSPLQSGGPGAGGGAGRLGGSGLVGSTGGSGATIVGAGGNGITAPGPDAAADAVVGPGAPDANPALPAGMLAVAPPDVACTGELDAAVECEFPASTCSLRMACEADVATCMGGSKWIVYYQNARCVAGHCVWDQSYFQCDPGSSCHGGACAPVITTG